MKIEGRGKFFWLRDTHHHRGLTMKDVKRYCYTILCHVSSSSRTPRSTPSHIHYYYLSILYIHHTQQTTTNNFDLSSSLRQTFFSLQTLPYSSSLLPESASNNYSNSNSNNPILPSFLPPYFYFLYVH